MISKENYEILKSNYGKIASWAIWREQGSTPKSNMRDVSMFDDDYILNELNPKVVFVGLNASGVHDGYMDESRPWCFFHSSNPRGHDYKLRYALIGTQFWGGYITDIIKEFPEVDSTKVGTYLSKHPEIIKKNINLFLNELSYLDDNPLIVALGDKTYSILNEHLGRKYQIVKIKHYSYTIGKEDYRKEALDVLEKQTILSPRPVEATPSTTSRPSSVSKKEVIKAERSQNSQSTEKNVLFNWDSDSDSLLEQTNNIVSAILNQSNCVSKRNPTAGEKCINIYYKGANCRIAHIWPKKKSKKFDVCLKMEIIEQIIEFAHLPADLPVKPQLGMRWRKFIVSQTHMEEIVKEIAIQNP